MIGKLRAVKRNLDQFVITNKGERCEAKIYCFQKPVGSIIAEPEDENGESLGKLIIWVCGNHKLQALQAAENFAKNYELKHKRIETDKRMVKKEANR